MYKHIFVPQSKNDERNQKMEVPVGVGRRSFIFLQLLRFLDISRYLKTLLIYYGCLGTPTWVILCLTLDQTINFRATVDDLDVFATAGSL